MHNYDLTPGILNESARGAFKYGGCGALAIALHEATGWPLIAVTDAHNVMDGVSCMGSALHWMVRRPDGKLIDIDGAHDPDDVLNEYQEEADDGEAAIGRTNMAHITEWYIECQGEPVPVDLARSFVEPLLKSLAVRPEPDDGSPSP